MVKLYLFLVEKNSNDKNKQQMFTRNVGSSDFKLAEMNDFPSFKAESVKT